MLQIMWNDVKDLMWKFKIKELLYLEKKKLYAGWETSQHFPTTLLKRN